MRVEHKNGQLIIRDQPLGFWVFYSFFVIGGIVALVLSVSAAPDLTTALVGSLIGIGNIAGGLHMIRREPASIVVFDLGSDEVRVCRWYPIGKKEKVYPTAAFSSAEVQTTEHTDGGYVYRPRLGMGESGFVPVSMFWYQTKEKSEEVAIEIRHFLRIPPNNKKAGDHHIHS